MKYLPSDVILSDNQDLYLRGKKVASLDGQVLHIFDEELANIDRLGRKPDYFDDNYVLRHALECNMNFTGVVFHKNIKHVSYIPGPAPDLHFDKNRLKFSCFLNPSVKLGDRDKIFMPEHRAEETLSANETIIGNKQYKTLHYMQFLSQEYSDGYWFRDEYALISIPVGKNTTAYKNKNISIFSPVQLEKPQDVKNCSYIWAATKMNGKSIVALGQYRLCSHDYIYIDALNNLLYKAFLPKSPYHPEVPPEILKQIDKLANDVRANHYKMNGQANSLKLIDDISLAMNKFFNSGNSGTIFTDSDEIKEWLLSFVNISAMNMDKHPDYISKRDLPLGCDLCSLAGGKCGYFNYSR